jgi:galactitol-specific phosphotransferase system IIB component
MLKKVYGLDLLCCSAVNGIATSTFAKMEIAKAIDMTVQKVPALNTESVNAAINFLC